MKGEIRREEMVASEQTFGGFVLSLAPCFTVAPLIEATADERHPKRIGSNRSCFNKFAKTANLFLDEF